VPVDLGTADQPVGQRPDGASLPWRKHINSSPWSEGDGRKSFVR